MLREHTVRAERNLSLNMCVCVRTMIRFWVAIRANCAKL